MRCTPMSLDLVLLLEVSIIWTASHHWGEEKASSPGSLLLLGEKSPKSEVHHFWLQGSKRLKAAVSRLDSHPSWRQVEKAMSKKAAVKMAVLPSLAGLG